MFESLRKTAGRMLLHIPGWHTGRKIVVFESDDWGSVRMSSRENLRKLAESGIQIQHCHYMQKDALASEEDLKRLFDVLGSYRDSNGNTPVITSNVIMTNPDFDKINADNFSQYHYELFTETLKKYPEHQNCFTLWEEGMNKGLIHPQFHGREHLNIQRWMKFLGKSDSDTRIAFHRGVFGLSTKVTSEERKSYMASYDWDDDEGRNFILNSVSEGLSLFKKIFGYRSLSSIAPNYVWHRDIERLWNKHGVRFIQGSRVQRSPEMDGKRHNYIRHYTGQINSLGQRYLVRNGKFEPSADPDIDWVDKCMHDIETAFYWKKPAIIETHRVNFIGFIDPQNRDQNLIKFGTLLQNIIQKWPEVEFMTSDQLGKTIENDE